MLSALQRTKDIKQTNTKGRTSASQIYRNIWAAVCLCKCVSVHLNFSACLICLSLPVFEHRWWSQVDEGCSKLTHIKGSLGLCSAVSATGDILGSEPFITLNARLGPNHPSTQQVYERTDQDRWVTDRGSRWKLVSLDVLQFVVGQQHADASSKSQGKPFKRYNKK